MAAPPFSDPHCPRPRSGHPSSNKQMLATLAADPMASLVDTAFVGKLGATQLAGVGTAMSVYNAATKAR